MQRWCSCRRTSRSSAAGRRSGAPSRRSCPSPRRARPAGRSRAASRRWRGPTASGSLGGGMAERSGDHDRPFNTCAVFAPDGRLAARYRKIHLFDVDLAERVLPRVGRVLRRRRARHLLRGGRPPGRALHLLRSALPRAVPRALRGRGGGDGGPRGVHRDHGQGSLARAPPGARHRGAGLRDRRRPVGQAPGRAADVRQVVHRRPLGRGHRPGLGGRGRDHGGGRPRLPRPRPGDPALAPAPPLG